MPFANTLGLYALLSLIPLIILYLIKPKPQDKTIPSLMFLIKDRQKIRQHSILRKFIRNLLFLIQLLVLLLLSLAVAAPYMNVQYDIESEHTVLVLDVSGSMQTKAGSKTRFEKAIDEAKSSLSRTNTIILAENNPIVVIEEEDKEVALEILSKLEPKATTTNIGDAMIIARGILEGKTGRVVVISDFSTAQGSDLLAVEKTMTSKEINVDFIDVSKKAKNMGIINLEVGKQKTRVYVKNFNEEEENIPIKLIKDDKVVADSKLKIAPDSIESVIFDTLEGISKIEIDAKDDLELDNYAYISNPLRKKINVLLITNTEKTNLETALLSSPDIALSIVNPPVLTITTNNEKIEPYSQDIIIMHQAAKDEILPGTFEDIKRYVEKGGNLVITAQDDLNKIDTLNLNPVSIKEISKDPANVCADIINEFTKQFEEERCFAVLSKHFDGKTVNEAVKIASAEDDAVIALMSYKKGTVVYYGIIDKESDFSTLPSYPVFWNDLINFLAKTENIGDYNLKTGKILNINKQKVKTPSDSITTDRILLDEQGIYEFDSKNFAVNMLDEDESNAISESSMFKKGEKDTSTYTEIKEKKLSLDILLLGLVFLLLSFETIYIKRRGDL